MANSSRSIRALDRATYILDAVVRDRGRHSLTDLAGQLGLPVTTTHRIVATLVTSGYLAPVRRGRFTAGPALISLSAAVQETMLLEAIARPVLDKLSRRTGLASHLGVLEEDMVTYIVKAGGEGLFTREGGQLEAYCSGIGKILLSQLGEFELGRYLASGTFVPLTERTRVDPVAIRRELDRVRADGFAIDAGEVAPNLVCVAVPVHDPAGQAMASVSISRVDADPDQMPPRRLIDELFRAAREIEERLDYASKGSSGNIKSRS